jgi:hypothetical protein
MEHIVPAHEQDEFLDSCDREPVHYENNPEYTPLSQPQLSPSTIEDAFSHFNIEVKCFIAKEHEGRTESYSSSDPALPTAQSLVERKSDSENSEYKTATCSDVPTHEVLGVHSGNSGSDVSSSEEPSSSSSDELAQPPTFPSPCASHAPKQNEFASDGPGKYNEVVSGHEYPKFPIMEHAKRVPNIAVQKTLPQEQTAADISHGNLLVPSNAWPPRLTKEEKDCDVDEAMETEGQLPQVCSEVCPRNAESCLNNNGHMVIGCGDSSRTHLGRILPGIVAEPRQFMEKAIESVGKAMNHAVATVHHDPQNDVKFYIRKTIFVKKEKHRRTSTTEDVPVSDPANSLQCPEAFDGRLVLRHMSRKNNFHEYAALFDYRKPRDFKSSIDQVLGRIPGRRNPLITWDILRDTLARMKDFMLNAIAGLVHANKYNLAIEISNGMEELDDITENANHAQELSTK